MIRGPEGWDIMGETIRLDRVFAFRNQISFLIPHDWVEADASDDFYLYHAPQTESGWLRVSLTTLALTGETPSERLQRLQDKWLEDEGVRVFHEEETRNLLKKWEKDTVEDGEPIHLFYWSVANKVEPDSVLVALFSYTVLSDRMNELGTIDTVNLVEELVSMTLFSRPHVIQ